MIKSKTIKYYVLFILIFICCGCSLKNKNKETSNVLVTTKPTENQPKESLPPIVKDDSLLELSVEDFNREYEKLPDDYEIKIGIRPVDFGNIFIIDLEQFHALHVNKSTNTYGQKNYIRLKCH